MTACSGSLPSLGEAQPLRKLLLAAVDAELSSMGKYLAIMVCCSLSCRGQSCPIVGSII